MHVLISFCNRKVPETPALALVDADSCAFSVVLLPPEVPRINGITGLAADSHYLYAAVQLSEDPRAKGLPGPSSLLIFALDELRLLSQYIFRHVLDVHSICVAEDRLYVVSTGTDEVISLRVRDGGVLSEEVFWRPEPGASRADLHHLNGICVWDGEWFVCGFGKRPDRRWNSARDGFIINITRNEKVVGGIEQPHSLCVLDGGLAYCESQKMTVCLDGTRTQRVPGYSRGLCRVGGKLFVGTSVGRQVSKSTGTLQNPAEGVEPGGRCAVVRIAAETLEHESTRGLGMCAQEVYDLLPVEDTRLWPVAPELEWRDAALGGLIRAVDAHQICALSRIEQLESREVAITRLENVVKEQTELAEHFAAQLAQREATIAELGRQLEETDRLRRERDSLRQALDTRDQSAEQFQMLFKELREELVGRHENLQSMLCDLLSSGAGPQVRAGQSAQRLAYRQLVQRLREMVRSHVPPNAIVVVISKGDDELVRLSRHRGWHFPQDELGAYAGYYPANGLAAVAHLEVLRARGAQYLVVPDTAAWWFDSYPEFREHLERRYRAIRQEGAGTLYSLCDSSALGETACEETLTQLVTRFRAARGRGPSMLDWDTGQRLAASFPDLAVFGPPVPNYGRLPYLDRSLDVVAVATSSPEVLAEAKRVAEVAVVNFSNSETGRPKPDIFWIQEPLAQGLQTTSIVIPVFNHWKHTAACLAALRTTLPEDFRGEILVVDDASTDETPDRLRRLAEQDPRLRVLRNTTNSGFIDTCNRGAEAATGEFLVFLNNDAVPLPGWLPPLLHAVDRFPHAGAVGGKLLFPDGHLQEAGGIIFRDASAAHFGRGEPDATLALFSYVREVDYCSAALLATPRLRFQEMGGFDSMYRPGYYEDVDYCFRLRAKGFRVYYQPESVVVHLEGASSGNDPSAGMKQHQAINRQRFLERWQGVLESHPQRPTHFDWDAWYLLAHRAREVAQL
jgi:GT2 family glycosyltransferase